VHQNFKSTCCYCGVGCGIAVKKEPDGRIWVEGDKEHNDKPVQKKWSAFAIDPFNDIRHYFKSFLDFRLNFLPDQRLNDSGDLATWKIATTFSIQN